MKNTNLFLPGFHLSTLRRTPRTASQKLADKLKSIRQKSISQLGECFSNFVPGELLKPHQSGDLSRRRLFSKENIFWGFFSQILNADGGCAEVVRMFQAFAASRAFKQPSSSSSAYCQARHRFKEADLQSIFEHTSGLAKHSHAYEPSLQGRRVIVVDGTGVSMPDTIRNQKDWPQLQSQKPGCGFPQARICACFDLHTGILLSYKLGNKKSNELPLLRMQWDTFKSGDIFLGDKGFCSYYDVAKFIEQGVDSVITLARRKPVTAAQADQILGNDDLLIHWPKPNWNKCLSYSHDQWLLLPERIDLRQIKVTINKPGFRSKSFYIVTSLIDENNYSAEELASLYYKRWDVELFFRDIKTTMGMDILRCKSPDMIRKELLMHFIVYNCIRLLMLEAAQRNDIPIRSISFKASIQGLRQWEPLLRPDISHKERIRLVSLLYASIASTVIPHRPWRKEPRCIKRRPKPFQKLTMSRHEMVEIPHRNKYRAKAA